MTLTEKIDEMIAEANGEPVALSEAEIDRVARTFGSEVIALLDAGKLVRLKEELSPERIARRQHYDS